MFLAPLMFFLVIALICGVGANCLLPNEITTTVINWTSLIAIGMGIANFLYSNVINDGTGNETSIISFFLCIGPACIQISVGLLSIGAVHILKPELMRGMYACELGILIPTLGPLALFVYAYIGDLVRR